MRLREIKSCHSCIIELEMIDEVICHRGGFILDIAYYEALLEKRQPSRPGMEAMWDARAKSFSAAQKAGAERLPKLVIEQLLQRGLLAGDVLDIGGGAGRYAIPFAAHASTVTMTDISSQMLEITQDIAKAAGRGNLEYVKLDWTAAGLKELGWEKRYDLVFASMCPAIRSREGIEKMTAAARGYCQINQFIERDDNISYRLKADLGVEAQHDPHNDREVVYAFFNLLWLQGFSPEIAYISDETRQTLRMEDALPRFSHHFEATAQIKGTTVQALLESYSTGGALALEGRSTLAVIRWKA